MTLTTIYFADEEDIFIRPDECYPSSIVLDDYNNSTENAISDLEKIECSDIAKYTEIRISPYVQMLKKEICVNAKIF